MELAMVDDRVVAPAEARVKIHDGGVYFGDGVYVVLRICDGRWFALAEHMQRFERSLSALQMAERVDMAAVRERLERAREAAGLAEALVYFHVTRGRRQRSLVIEKDWEAHFLLTIRRHEPRAAKTMTAVTHPDWRWRRCDIKSLNLLANVLAKDAAKKAGAGEAILVDEQGLITEATSSSVMMVKDGELWTAPLTANILPSITRGLLLQWADRVGLEAREESFTVAQAQAADEFFIAGTTTEVTPVTKLDGRHVGTGEEGKYGKRLQELLRQAMYDGD